MRPGTPAALLAGLVLALCVPPCLHAQAGFIVGIVRDSVTHAPILGAEIDVSTDCWSYSAITSRDGRFQTRPLPAWSYELTARRVGYRTSLLTRVTLIAGDTAQVEFHLAPRDTTPLEEKPAIPLPPELDFGAADSVPNAACPSGVDVSTWRRRNGIWRYIGQCRSDSTWWAWQPNDGWFPLHCPPFTVQEP